MTHTKQRRQNQNMADSTLTRTTPLINTLPEFTSGVYASIAPSELVVFAVYALQDDGHYSATEEIVSACFRLFPHRFSLKNYFYWPDSASIVSFLNEAKNNGDLKGNPTEGFAVKVQGRQTVKRVAKVLGVTLPAPEKKVQAPAVEIKQVEPVQPSQPEAEKKEEVPQAITPVQPVLSEKPVKKKVTAPQKKKPARNPLVKKLRVKVEKKSRTPLTKKVPAKKQEMVSEEKKSVAPVTKEKPVKKNAAVSKEKKPVKKLPVKKQVVVEEKKPVPFVAAKVPARKKKPSVLPVVKKSPAKKKIAAQPKKKPVKKTPPKQAVPVKVKELQKPELVKQEPLLQVKVEEQKKIEQAKPVASIPAQKIPAPKAEKPKKQSPVKSAQPAQLTMLPLVEEKKEKSASPVEKKVEPKPVKVQMVIVPAVEIKVSKEEKVKAGKVVQVMERSDAYRQYKKNGDKSKISEFDFRSLLLCTMESSPETLARNVNTFKGYANIQNRQDLVVFLNFVEGSFSGLLNSSGKKLAKKK